MKVVKLDEVAKTEATPFLDVSEAAAFLKVKPATIYAWVHQKRRKFPVRYHGRKLVFLSDDLRQWSDEVNRKQF